MNNSIRGQIYNNLISKETEDLLEIWQNGDPTEWDAEVFEIIKEILLERLGYIPPQSTKTQALQVLGNIDRYLENNELDTALSECELAIQMEPNLAIAYNYRGEIYVEMGQLENAITNYQRAIQLDPELKDAWDKMLSIEFEIEEEFQNLLQSNILTKHLNMPITMRQKRRWENAKRRSKPYQASLLHTIILG